MSYTHEWQAYLDALSPLAEKLSGLMPEPSDPQLREEFYSKMFAEMAGAYIGLQVDPKYPDFGPLLNQRFCNIGVPNPDNVYYNTPIDDDGVYQLSGFRGTVLLANFQLGKDSILARGEGGYGATAANYDLDDGVHLGKNGEFEIMLSRERPAGYEGDWWLLPEGATYLMLRQSAYDWINELDARVTIDRLDTPAAKPRRTAEQIQRDLKQTPIWVENYMRNTLEGPLKLKDKGLTNEVIVWDLSHIAGLKTQLYSQTYFNLTADEALVYEVEMPNQCRYWNYQLANEMWETLDFMHNQTSVNGFTAQRDSDGKVRIVVSAQDPGVPNWLNTLGYKRGDALGRWERCDKPPVISVKKIKVADVRQHLPEDTPVVTAEQREASIRLRRKGAQLRRRW